MTVALLCKHKAKNLVNYVLKVIMYTCFFTQQLTLAHTSSMIDFAIRIPVVPVIHLKIGLPMNFTIYLQKIL